MVFPSFCFRNESSSCQSIAQARVGILFAAEAQRLIGTLIKHHVAITSTLPGTASTLPRADISMDGRPTVRPAVLQSMAPPVRDAYLYSRNRPANKAAQENTALLLRRDMELERAFVAAGGLLLAGSDPAGINGLIPGFGDQREIELLVEAGFAPVQAIQIATLNGAIFLGRIADIEDIEMLFKDGVGYDPGKLLDSVRGHYGEY
jgi:hypothetical protein